MSRIGLECTEGSIERNAFRQTIAGIEDAHIATRSIVLKLNRGSTPPRVVLTDPLGEDILEIVLLRRPASAVAVMSRRFPGNDT